MSKSCSRLQEYAAIFAGAGTNPGEKTLEDKFFEKEASSGNYPPPDLYTIVQVEVNVQSFMQLPSP